MRQKPPEFDPFKPTFPLDGSALKPVTADSYVPSPINSEAPRTLRRDGTVNYWDMTLEEVLQYALGHSKVMVDSGGRVLQLPAAAQTVYDPAIRETDPLSGPMAALSAYDAQFSSLAMFREGNNFNNNVLLGGGTYFLNTTQFVADTAITKRAATGGTFRVDTNTQVFSSDAPANYFSSVNSTAFGGEFRQPLLRGAGVEFNRIAGAYQVPGAFNGIVLARINTDISLLDFETSVRTVLIDVERAYWDLALSYRDLDAKIAARDATLETWRLIHKKLQVGMAGADEEGEARAREQYYLLQAQVENAYSGAPPISAALGSTVGNAVIGNSAGVLGNERRLRLLMGLPPTDDRLIRPITDPARVAVTFDWRASVNDALSRRVELRRQALMLKRREAELAATRNLRLPQLDAVAGASYRAFSNDFSQIIDPAGASRSSHFQNTNYNVGLNLTVPLGNRLAKTAIRNAELQVARERAILDEQRMHVVHELSSSITELDRAFVVMNTNYNRRAAAEQQKAAIARKYEVGAVGLEALLDAQRRWADAEGSFHRAVFDYNRAIADVHLSRGSLLAYDGVRLADSPPEELDCDRFRTDAFMQEPEINYGFSPSTKHQAPAALAPDAAGATPMKIVPLPETLPPAIVAEPAAPSTVPLPPVPLPPVTTPVSTPVSTPVMPVPSPPKVIESDESSPILRRLPSTSEPSSSSETTSKSANTLISPLPPISAATPPTDASSDPALPTIRPLPKVPEPRPTEPLPTVQPAPLRQTNVNRAPVFPAPAESDRPPVPADRSEPSPSLVPLPKIQSSPAEKPIPPRANTVAPFAAPPVSGRTALPPFTAPPVVAPPVVARPTFTAPPVETPSVETPSVKAPPITIQSPPVAPLPDSLPGIDREPLFRVPIEAAPSPRTERKEERPMFPAPTVIMAPSLPPPAAAASPAAAPPTVATPAFASPPIAAPPPEPPPISIQSPSVAPLPDAIPTKNREPLFQVPVEAAPSPRTERKEARPMFPAPTVIVAPAMPSPPTAASPAFAAPPAAAAPSFAAPPMTPLSATLPDAPELKPDQEERPAAPQRSQPMFDSP